MKRKLFLFALALPVFLSQNSFAQSSRLIGSSYWRHNGAAFKPVDTTGYNYSGSRGGDLNNTLKFDNSTKWNYTTDSIQNSWHYVQTFDSLNNILTSASQYWDTSSGWVPYLNNLYTYNALNQIITEVNQSWNGTMWVPVTEQVYSYDSGHVLYSVLNQNWNAFTVNWDPASQRTYYFDGAHRLVNETDQVFVAGVPTYTTQHAYTYTSANLLVTTSVSSWSGTGWAFDSLYTNGYDSSGNILTTLGQTFNAVSSVWENQTLHLFSNWLPGTRLPQTEIYQTWDSVGSGAWNNIIQYTYTYNSFGQMTSSTGTSWNVVGVFEFAVGDPLYNYYYGTYVAGVKNVNNAVAANDANIYPVPAQNMIHIDLNWANAQAATIGIYDMQGRLMKQMEIPAAVKASSAVSVSDLAAGVYFVKINGTVDQIVKQIVVAH